MGQRQCIQTSETSQRSPSPSPPVAALLPPGQNRVSQNPETSRPVAALSPPVAPAQPSHRILASTHCTRSPPFIDCARPYACNPTPAILLLHAYACNTTLPPPPACNPALATPRLQPYACNPTLALL